MSERPQLVVRWWALGLRGLAALGLGVVAFSWPERTFEVLVLLFGVLLLLDGLLALGSVLVNREGWGRVRFYLTLAEGLVGIAAAAAILLLPEVSRLVVIYVVAAWAILTGVLEISAAVRLRRVVRGEWLLAASGMLSLAFGVLIGLQPGLGVVARMWLLGAYASLFGILLLLLALRLYRWRAPAPLAQHAEPPAEPSSEGSGQA